MVWRWFGGGLGCFGVVWGVSMDRSISGNYEASSLMNRRSFRDNQTYCQGVPKPFLDLDKDCLGRSYVQHLVGRSRS